MPGSSGNRRWELTRDAINGDSGLFEGYEAVNLIYILPRIR